MGLCYRGRVGWMTRASESRAAWNLEKRKGQIRYAEFHAEGYPIGSGAVESANKLVVEPGSERRCKRTVVCR